LRITGTTHGCEFPDTTGSPMAKVTPKKTASAAKKTAASKKTAKKAAKTSSTAKKKPVAKKAAAKEKPILAEVPEDKSAKETVKSKATAKKASAKKTATKKVASKAAAKKASSKKKAAAAASSAKSVAETPAATSKKAASKKTTKKAATSAVKPKTTKKASRKKVPATNPKNTAAESPVDNDQDDSDMDMDLPVSRQPAVVPYERDSSGHYMDTEQLEHFRKKLTDWKQQLMEEVDRTVGHMKDDATNFPDPNDRATQEEEFSLELRTRDRERKLIKKINEAQKRIDDDEYGYCETCGIEIGVNRLEARPTAELCIDCKTLEEIRERQTA